MRAGKTVAIVIALALSGVSADALLLTFDDIPEGSDPDNYYGELYGIAFDRRFVAVSHIGSSWGPPRSGTNVLTWVRAGAQSTWYGMMFKKIDYPLPPQILIASSVGAYYSTEPGVVLMMIGYRGNLSQPVAAATIGAAGESWNNRYVQISSAMSGISSVELRPVTANALEHFCADDVTIEFIPEPSSLAAFAFALAGMGIRCRRRRG